MLASPGDEWSARIGMMMAVLERNSQLLKEILEKIQTGEKV